MIMPAAWRIINNIYIKKMAPSQQHPGVLIHPVGSSTYATTVRATQL